LFFFNTDIHAIMAYLDGVYWFHGIAYMRLKHSFKAMLEAALEKRVQWFMGLIHVFLFDIFMVF